MPSSKNRAKFALLKWKANFFLGQPIYSRAPLKSITEDDTTTRVIILQLKNARDIDATACLALQQLHDYLKNSGRHLIGCGITHQIWDVLSDSGMVEIIGKNNLFIFDERHPHLSVQKAFLRAYDILKLETAKINELATPAIVVSVESSAAQPNGEEGLQPVIQTK